MAEYCIFKKHNNLGCHVSIIYKENTLNQWWQKEHNIFLQITLKISKLANKVVANIIK